jgi:hypothetical protein
VLVTGGVSGIGEGVGRSFFEARRKAGGAPDVFHILPNGYASWDYGVTLFGGADMRERREILGRLARLYLAMEGGAGTAHEGKVALGNGASVIPLGRTGGFAGSLYRGMKCPDFAPEASWQILGSQEANPEQTAEAIYETVKSCLH